MPNGYTATVWVEAPDGWSAERVREEIDTVFGFSAAALDDAEQDGLTLNTIYTPKPDGYNDDPASGWPERATAYERGDAE